MSETVSEREVQADNETGTDLQIQNTSKKTPVNDSNVSLDTIQTH